MVFQWWSEPTLLGKFTKSDIMGLSPEIGRAYVQNALKKLCDDRIIKKHGGGRPVFLHLKISLNS